MASAARAFAVDRALISSAMGAISSGTARRSCRSGSVPYERDQHGGDGHDAHEPTVSHTIATLEAPGMATWRHGIRCRVPTAW